MSELIPSMSIADFKKLKVADIKNLKAVEVTADGEHLFTAIIPHGDWVARDYVKIHAEQLAVKANISGGVDPKEATCVPA